MSRIYTIDEIAAAVKPIAEKYGLEKVWLFGSYARGEATESSDIDLVVDRKEVMSMFELGGVLEELKDVLRKNVDIVTVCSLYHPVNLNANKNFRGALERDKKVIYEPKH